MFDALYIGATGMHAQQATLDVIANNLANLQTAGYKKGRVAFSELIAPVAGLRVSGADGGLLAALQGVGAGVAIAHPARLFEGGELKTTESPWDLAIQGDGFLELSMPDGSRAYTRGGTLKVNADGQLATQAGLPLKPGLFVPDKAQALHVGADGRVQVRMPGQANAIELGQLEVVRFANPGGLVAQGDNVYRATEASAEAIAGRAGEDGVGSLVQGALEGSNVKLVEEMVNLMVAQRAYEASAKVVQASDEMLGMVNGLRR